MIKTQSHTVFCANHIYAQCDPTSSYYLSNVALDAVLRETAKNIRKNWREVYIRSIHTISFSLEFSLRLQYLA